MAVANNPQHLQVFNGFLRPIGIHFASMYETPHCADDLHIEKVRGMEVLVVSVQPIFDTAPKLRL